MDKQNDVTPTLCVTVPARYISSFIRSQYH